MPLNSLCFSDRERPWMPPVCPGFGPQSTRALSGNYFRSWPEAIIRLMISRNAAMGGERTRSGGNLGRKTRWSVSRAARLHGAQKCQSARGAVASRSSRSVILEEFLCLSRNGGELQDRPSRFSRSRWNNDLSRLQGIDQHLQLPDYASRNGSVIAVWTGHISSPGGYLRDLTAKARRGNSRSARC